jgi:hypothetical protein
MPETTAPYVPPDRSLVQRQDALRNANLVRTRRAQLKKDLKAGRVSIDSVLRYPPEYALTAKVFDLLLAVPKYGRVKVNKILTQCRVSPSKTLGGLTEGQRDRVLQLIRHTDVRMKSKNDLSVVPARSGRGALRDAA